MEPVGGSRWKHRSVQYFVEPESDYLNCGSMAYACQLCSALHFLGERNKQPGSPLTYLKFSECCSSGNVTRHFLISIACEQCHEPFKNEKGQNRKPDTRESCISCGHLVSKIIPSFADPPALIRELLTSNSGEARHFRKNICMCNSALSMASVRVQFVERVPGLSKYNATVTVHGRMYHEIGF